MTTKIARAPMRDAADEAADAFDLSVADAEPNLHAPHGPLAFFLDFNPKASDFRSDAIEALSADARSLSPKYLYDERGSALFDQITTLPEYYPTRTEQQIVADNAAAIGAAIGENRAVYEYGSGASEKIDRLLALMHAPAAYVALDISREHLIASASAFAERAGLPVGAICADFTTTARPPDGLFPDDQKWLGFFPGSTLGNLSQADARLFLDRASETLGEDAQFLIGVDLEKDADVLRLAYDDPQGVSAAFNLNLLRRMRRELDASIDLDAFEHHIEIHGDPLRVSLYLRARRDTEIVLSHENAERRFAFGAGDKLHTEDSRKFSLRALEALVASTPWRLTAHWTDPKDWFAVCLLSNN